MVTENIITGRTGTITGGYSEGYGNGGLVNWSIANEERGSGERGVVRELRRPCQKKRDVICT